MFQSLKDSESEEVLNAINPNEVYASAGAQELLSESDSGLSEDLCSDGAHEQKLAVPQMPAVYQVVYDISSLGAVITEQGPSHMDVISIELGDYHLSTDIREDVRRMFNVLSLSSDDWSSQMLLPDSCVVNELVSSVKTENDDKQQTHTADSSLVVLWLCNVENVLKTHS